MGIRIIKNLEGIEFLAIGAVNGSEIIQARNKIYDTKQTTPFYKYILFDNSHCTEYNITANDIISIADLDITASRTNPNIIMATIESDHLIFSLTEVWHAHIEDHINKTRSFSNRHSAINWIKSHIE